VKLRKGVFTLVFLAFVILCTGLVPIFKVESSATSVTVSLGREIDLYSQRGGVGANQTGGVFQPQDEVVFYALVTYNEWPMQNILVSFEVDGPTNPYTNITFVLTATTNENGIAEIQFRIPLPIEHKAEIVFGVWKACATANVAEQTVMDTMPFVVIILGDVDGDGKVEMKDLVLLAKAYGSRPGDPNWNFMADMDNNNFVGLLELVIIAKNYGQHYP